MVGDTYARDEVARRGELALAALAGGSRGATQHALFSNMRVAMKSGHGQLGYLNDISIHIFTDEFG